MAKTTGALRHTHKYFRRDDGRWACMRDGCTHFLPKNMAPLPAGSQSICHSCEKEFMLAPYNMQEDRPKCDNCTEELDMIGKFIEMKEEAYKKTLTPMQQTLLPFTKHGAFTKKQEVEKEEEDRPEVIEADEKHAPDCDVYAGGECNCK